YQAASDALIQANRQLTQRRLLWSTTFGVIGAAGYYGSYGYVVWRAVTGAISVGTLTFLSGAIAAAQSELQTLFSLFSLISQQALYLNDLFTFLAIRPAIGAPPAPHAIAPQIQRGLEFRDVSFRYGDGPPILDDLSFELQPGEHVAIVG